MANKIEKDTIGFDGLGKRIADLGKDTNDKSLLKAEINEKLTPKENLQQIQENDKHRMAIYAIIAALCLIVLLTIIPDKIIPKIDGIPLLLIQRKSWPILVVFIVLFAMIFL